MTDHSFQRAWLGEQVAGARDNFQRFRSTQRGESPLI
jgi:hypothetical protein